MCWDTGYMVEMMSVREAGSGSGWGGGSSVRWVSPQVWLDSVVFAVGLMVWASGQVVHDETAVGAWVLYLVGGVGAVRRSDSASSISPFCSAMRAIAARRTSLLGLLLRDFSSDSCASTSLPVAASKSAFRRINSVPPATNATACTADFKAVVNSRELVDRRWA